MTVKVILRCAPILTKDDLMDVENVPHHEMFQTGSLTPVRDGVDENGKDIYRDVPVCINHESSNVVGLVTHLREDSDAEGGHWLFAHARIDKPPGWLNRDTRVSISYGLLSRSSGMGGDWSRVDRGWLTEISLLSPSCEPAHPRARVVWLETVEEPSPTTPAVPTSSDRAAGEVIPIRRAARRRPTVFPRSEFDRRWDFAAELEEAGIDGVFEAEIEHMQRLERAMQLGRMSPSLHELARAR